MKFLRIIALGATFLLPLMSLGCGGGGSEQAQARPAPPPLPVPVPFINATPIMDMTGADNYLSFPGGLYENSSNLVPSDHDLAGKAILNQIQPLDQNGLPDPNGKIVFAGLGMSNVFYEFSYFLTQLPGDSRVNQTTMVPINGAQIGVTACFWAVTTGVPNCDPKAPEPKEFCPNATSANPYDVVRDCFLTPVGLTEAQVQIAWIKQADKDPAPNGLHSLCDPTRPGCVNDDTTDALHYERLLGDILRACRVRYPNLRMVFMSSRIYGGYAIIALNPEPFAYENGFAVKWAIQAQIDQARGNGTDPIAGDLGYGTGIDGAAPWVAWGPYLWADGIHPRSDGLVWCNGQAGTPCNGEKDFRSEDGTHPTDAADAKVYDLWLNYFLNSPYTSWFRP